MKFIIPGRLDGLNEYTSSNRTNRYKANNDKKVNQMHVKYAIRKAKLSRVDKYPVKLKKAWYEPNKRRYIDNVVFATKFIQDALVNEGTLNDLTKQYKAAFNNNSNKALIKDLEEVDILYIDDLFKGSTSEYDVKNICYDIINYRYKNRKITIISSEYDFSELNEIDNAIAGRIKQMCKKYLMIVRKTDENNYRLKGE